MHILFLTDNFPPEVNAPASRTFEHCREWVRAGYQVTVITCAPNFPKGKLYPGYKNKLLQRERINGIEVIRVWTYITANSGTLRRMLDYISFMFAAVLASLLVRKPDLVIGTSPQFFTVCAAWIVSVLKRIPFIFELRDIWPESIKAVGAIKSGMLLAVLEQIEMFLYRHAAQIICVTNRFKSILVKRGINESKIRVVKNGVDLARFSPMPKDSALLQSLGLEGHFTVGYVGTHGLAHRLEIVLQAARIVQDMRFEIRFLLVGDGAEKVKLKQTAKVMKLNNVRFIDSVDKNEVCKYWSLLDVAIIHLKADRLFQSVIPSKLFECMAMDVPVLHGVKGESAEIVAQTGCGITFQPENSADLVQKILTLQSNPEKLKELSQAGLIAAQHNNRQVRASEMLGYLYEISGIERAIDKVEDKDQLREAKKVLYSHKNQTTSYTS